MIMRGRRIDPVRQLIDVLQRFDLMRLVAPFRRCLRCTVVSNAKRREPELGMLSANA